MLEHFALPITSVEEGTISVRVVPYGVPIQHGGRTVQFDPGSITVPDSVPVTVDHGDGVLDRVGVLRRSHEDGTALYATLDLADTQAGNEIRELARIGAITDVSAGVELSGKPPVVGGTHRLSGALDHVSMVAKGAFGEAGSKVLAVHSSDGGPQMENEEAVDHTTEIEQLTANVETLRATVAELAVPGNITEPEPKFTDIRDFVLTFAQANNGDPLARARIEEFVLADDTTSTAAGLVPNYFSTEIIGLIDNFRPYLGVITRDPIGPNGMTVEYPNRTQKPSVDVQATEKTEIESQSTTFDFVTVDLATYAGASDVSIQLIERSAPSFVSRLFQEYAGVYAEKTDADAVAAAVAGAGAQTAILADLGADPAATAAAVALGAGTIAQAMKRPATHMVVAVDRWAQLLELSDTDGRPLILPGVDGPNNAQGSGDLSTFTFRYRGLTGIVDPHAADGTCLLMWSGATVYLEQTPQQLRALQVSLLGYDMGVYGLFAHLVKYASGLYTITPA